MIKTIEQATNKRSILIHNETDLKRQKIKSKEKGWFFNSEVIDNLRHIPDGKFELWLVSVTLKLGEQEIRGSGRILQDK